LRASATPSVGLSVDRTTPMASAPCCARCWRSSRAHWGPTPTSSFPLRGRSRRPRPATPPKIFHHHRSSSCSPGSHGCWAGSIAAGSRTLIVHVRLRRDTLLALQPQRHASCQVPLRPQGSSGCFRPSSVGVDDDMLGASAGGRNLATPCNWCVRTAASSPRLRGLGDTPDIPARNSTRSARERSVRARTRLARRFWPD
jgi:hypothetical protein